MNSRLFSSRKIKLLVFRLSKIWFYPTSRHQLMYSYSFQTNFASKKTLLGISKKLAETSQWNGCLPKQTPHHPVLCSCYLLSSKLSFMVSQTFFLAGSKRLSNLANNTLYLEEEFVQIVEFSLEIPSFAHRKV